MQKAVSDFLFGLCFGMGLCLAYAVLKLVGVLIGQASRGPLAIGFWL